jgi:HK97 family phage portal protein
MATELFRITSRPPTLAARFRSAVRSYFQRPMSLKDPALARLFNDGYASRAGVYVDEQRALTYAPFWSAVSRISADVASLPAFVFRRRADGGKDRFPKHPAYRLLHDEANPHMSAMSFRECLQAHVLVTGNAFAEIERNGAGAPVALWPIPPYRVKPFMQTTTLPNGNYRAVLRYRIDGTTIIDAQNMLHVPGLGFDGCCGYSVIEKARESLGLGIAMQDFGATFFGNGTTFGGVITRPAEAGAMGPDAEKGFRENIQAYHGQGGLDRAFRVLLLQEGMRYERAGIPPDDAQFLESRAFQVTEIARWFNIPPHKLGDLSRATFSNIEMQSLEYVTDTLRPWLIRWEQECHRKLVAPAEQSTVFVEHSMDALLRGDSQARAAFYREMFEIGAFSINEIRNFENLNPIGADGDLHFVASTMSTIEHAKTAPVVPPMANRELLPPARIEVDILSADEKSERWVEKNRLEQEEKQLRWDRHLARLERMAQIDEETKQWREQERIRLKLQPYQDRINRTTRPQ